VRQFVLMRLKSLVKRLVIERAPFGEPFLLHSHND